MKKDLTVAVDYVMSLIPDSNLDPVTFDWHYIPVIGSRWRHVWLSSHSAVNCGTLTLRGQVVWCSYS